MPQSAMLPILLPANPVFIGLSLLLALLVNMAGNKIGRAHV